MKKKIIVIFGIDGTGKTTVSEALRSKIADSGKSAEIVYMGMAKETKLPLLKLLMNIKSKFSKKGGREVSINKTLNGWHRERGFFWLTIYFLELWTKYLFVVKKANSDYVLCDRYFYDGLVYANKKKFNLFRRLIPAPSFSFVLDVPAKIIMDRKNEADEESIKKFYSKAEKISKYFKLKKVDNTEPIEKVIDIIYEKIKK
jgi:thymidylate kinase